jgi:hypothetical protein
MNEKILCYGQKIKGETTDLCKLCVRFLDTHKDRESVQCSLITSQYRQGNCKYFVEED